mmetsp:Transcript_26004/g.49396  ORF Transcript_26004/g.49396 Transcript_26004/m.49396 type:complete len:187 (+) Transcript_26004:135-695(+)
MITTAPCIRLRAPTMYACTTEQQRISRAIRPRLSARRECLERVGDHRKTQPRRMHTAVAMFGFTREQQKKALELQVLHSGVSTLRSRDEFHLALQEAGTRLVCVEVTVDGCRPCMGFERKFALFAAHYTDTCFVKLNASNHPSSMSLAEELGITCTPTFLLYRDGAQLQRVVGPSQVTHTEREQCV